MSNQMDGTEIAIIGFTGRFPGAGNTQAFWRNLRDGVESVSFLTEQELDALGVASSVRDEANYVRAAATMDGVELFDAGFFGYSPKEAEIIDPQHRIFLECAWESLENAGYNPESFAGAIGVYGGATINTYLLCHLASRPEIINSLDLTQINIANGGDFLTTRVSYKLNLKGPSHLVQSACSTSLVAVHLACQNLLDEECDMALAGGVSVNVKFRAGYHYQEGGIVSPDGHCRPFDAEAQGTIFGSGVGIVVLKRLDDALRDRDTIHAVVKGSAINNDGSLKVGYTAPSVYGQAEVISEALANAGVEAGSISYVETHGTATPLGDPVEIAALTKAFRATTDKTQFCAIGSVKSNVGHLDAAAGVASLIKTVLALKHRQLPPSLHYRQPNPKCELSQSPFYVNAELSEWKPRRGVRRAGVSSFGVGGTNAHLIVEEAATGGMPEAVESERSAAEVLLISAKSESALEAATQNLTAHLQTREGEQQRLADIAYTLQVGRQHFAHRRAVVCRTHRNAVDVLSSGDSRFVFSRQHDGSQPKVAFLFPGQGSQHLHMARGLYHSQPIFRRHLDRCAEALLPLLKLDLRSVLYPAPEDSDAAAKRLQQTRFAQPALFSVEYALARMWMEWGVQPSMMLGHSLGEYVAACVAGALSLEDALKLVAARGRLMQPLAGGAMLAVSLGEAEVIGLARDGIALAALNGAQQSVLSGRASAIAVVEEKLRATGVECRRLQTEHAFHSTMMEPMIDEFREELGRVAWREPEIEYVSNVSGLKVKREEAMSAAYWIEHVRRTVRFGAGVEELLRSGARVILEIGPGESLSRLVRRLPGAAGRDVLATLPAQAATAGKTVDTMTAEATITTPAETEQQAAIQRREEDDETQLQRALGKVWAAGGVVNWSVMHETGRRVALPTYPFQRQRYWVEAATAQGATAAHTRSRASGAESGSWLYLPSWKRTLALPTPSAEEFPAYGTWIILSDGGGVGAGMARRLREMEQRVVFVEQGERFERLEAERYRVRGGEREDFGKLLRELAEGESEEEEGSERGIAVMHLWSLGEAVGEGGGEQESAGESGAWEEFERVQARGYYSLLALAQAFEQERIFASVRIVVAANKLHSITSEEIATPHKATLLGACRVIPQEQVNITCRCVDVVTGESESAQEQRLINQLLSESTERSSEVAVAYRGDQRWVQSFEPVALEAGRRAHGRATRGKLRAGGVYLILGGAEDMGELFAEHLYRNAGAKLLLVTQRELPPRDESQAGLQHGNRQLETGGDVKSNVESEQRERRQIEWMKRMEEQGAEVEAIAADVSDEAEMRAMVEYAGQRFGALHGVIHATESLVRMSFSPVGSTGRAESNCQFRSKVRSLLVLEKVLRDCELDFCLIFTSLSHLLGGPGYVAQAAANAFVSGFVEHHNRHSPFVWANVNWDGRRSEEAKEPDAVESVKRSRFGMTAAECVEAFRRILELETITSVVVSTGDLEERLAQCVSGESSREPVTGQPHNSVSSLHPRPKLQSTYVAPANDLEQAIAAVWQRALGIEPVGVEDNFFELGGDSLIAIQVIAELKRELQQEIPVVSLYEGLTIKSLVGVLESHRRRETDGVPETAQADEREERTMRRKLYQQKQRFKRKEAIG